MMGRDAHVGLSVRRLSHRHRKSYHGLRRGASIVADRRWNGRRDRAELATKYRALFSYASFAIDGGFLSVARRKDLKQVP
jgi:hypothetical protein